MAYIDNPFHHVGKVGPDLRTPFNRVPIFSTMGRGPRGTKGDKGDTGDPMTYESLTEEQRDDLIQDLLDYSEEDERQAAETTREDNETTRQRNERDRNLAEAQRVLRFAEIEQLAHGWTIYHCDEGEYDPDTLKPDIAGTPDPSTLYCVPLASAGVDDAWREWRYDTETEDFESIGVTQADIAAISTSDIDDIVDDDQQLTGTEVLKKTGFTYFWNKLKTLFASKLDAADYRRAYTWGEAKDEFTWGSILGDDTDTGTTQTTNLNLDKPGLNSTVDIDVINGDLDTIDTAIGNLQDSVSLNIQATAGTNVISRSANARQVGALVCISLQLQMSGTFNNEDTILTLSGIPAPPFAVFCDAVNAGNRAPLKLETDLKVLTNGAITVDQNWLAVTFTYIM